MSLGSPGRSWPGRSAEGGRGPYTSLQEEGSEGRTTCMGCRRLGTKRRRIYSLLLGQLLSVLIAGTAISSSLLAERGTSIPTTQSFLNYALLTSYLVFLRRRPPRVAWWKYAVQAVIDVEANYMVVLAYRYTSITSVTLLDCFAIPCAMMLSYLILGSRYSWLHVAGVIICLLGLVCTVLSDVIAAGDAAQAGSYPHALLGDLCCLVGAALYAMSNVMQEFLVKAHDPVEFLGMLGAMGSAISFVQAAVLESGAIRRAEWDGWSLGLMACFAVFLFAMYSLTALFLTEADATLFNLSLLTSDVYAVIYRWRFQHSRVNALYLVAFACTCLGLWVYQRPGPVNEPVLSDEQVAERRAGGCGEIEPPSWSRDEELEVG